MRHLRALDSAKVPRAPSLSASGPVSRRKWPYLSLDDLTPPAQRPSSPTLAHAGSHVVRHLRALDYTKVPVARAPSVPSSGAVLRRKWPKLSLGDLTPPAQQPSSSPLARAASHVVRHLRALDSAKVLRALAPPCLPLGQSHDGSGPI